MAKCKSRPFIVTIVSAFLALSILLVFDTQPWILFKYRSNEATKIVFQKQCEDLHRILEPYGVDYNACVKFNNDETLGWSYFAEIPITNGCVMNIYVFAYDGYLNTNVPCASVTLESQKYTVPKEAVIDVEEFPELFEVVSYFLGEQMETTELMKATQNLYQTTLKESDFNNSDNDSFYFINSKQIKRIFFELIDITVAFGHLDESDNYQSRIEYLCDARC